MAADLRLLPSVVVPRRRPHRGGERPLAVTHGEVVTERERREGGISREPCLRVPASRSELRREPRVTPAHAFVPGVEVVRQREREEAEQERTGAEHDPPDAHAALHRKGSTRSKKPPSPTAASTASATSVRSTLPEALLASSDGSAACSKEPFSVTNWRMKSASSGEALRPTTCSGIPARR